MIGKTLAHYEIVEKIGAGGMGEVYRARDSRLNRDVAVKVLPGHISADPEVRQRFEREARVISSLSHPNICTLYDVGCEDGVDFLVMEYLEGETLYDRLRRDPLPAKEVLSLGAQIADALDRAHRAGIIHRDLKPGNIMLTRDGAKLLDFGLAKTAEMGAASVATSVLTEANTEKPLTAEGTILGTFQYMAPEQLEGKSLDARTDIFSLGAVLYEMATGKRAFAGGSQASLIASILERDPAPISTVAPVSPPALDRTVLKCLAKDPDERWQTARDVASELTWIAEDSSRAGVPRHVSRRRRSRERMLLGLGSVLLAATIGLSYSVFRLSAREDRVVRAFIPPPEGTTFDLDDFLPGPVSVSPDGTRIAFVADHEDGAELLWVRHIDALTGQPLAGTDGASYPFWSPDSRMIGFFADGKLKKIAAEGGAALSLCDAENGKGGTWSEEDVILFTPRWDMPIYRVPAAGGEPQEVTALDEALRENSHRLPRFLEGGRRFLYFARSSGARDKNPSTVRLGSLDGEPQRTLFASETAAIPVSGHLLYVSENTLLARPFDEKRAELTGPAFPIAENVESMPGAGCGIFSASRNGVLVYQLDTPDVVGQLTWVDRSGNELGTLGEPSVYGNPVFSPNAEYLAVEDWSSGETADLWIFEVARGVRTRFTLGPGTESGAVWTPDGKSIVYSSDAAGRFDIYRKSVDGAEEAELLLQSPVDKSPTSISPDGRFLLFDQERGIWLLPLDGESEARPFIDGELTEFDGRFSPDGRWVAYVSTESQQPEVYVVPFPGPGRRYQVSTATGMGGDWSADGREIVFGTENGIFAVAMEATGSSLRIGPPELLFGVEDFTGGGPLPDHQRFIGLKTLGTPEIASLALVMNWTAELDGR